jgi:hypothetical protein
MTGKRITIALLAVLSLTACSKSTDDGVPRVASFTSPGSTSSAPAAAQASAQANAEAKAERPRERLDTTPEEYEALLEPYNECVRGQGAKPKSDWTKNERPGKAAIDKLVAADRYCGPLFTPLPPWEKDPANPKAKDFAHEVVKCLKNRGVREVEVGDNGVDIELGGPMGGDSIRKGMDLMPECEQKVAAGGEYS